MASNDDFRSQFGQDRLAIRLLSKGFFVELGANDGVSLSNTYAMEKTLGWNGICIEAIPDKYEQLKKNRSCICVSSLVDEVDDIEKTLIVPSYSIYRYGDLLSYIEGDRDGDMKKNQNDVSMTLKTKSLTTILTENNAPKLMEFLSLDTEGSELRILKGLDFTRYNFKLICVEFNHSRTEINQLLLSKGYTHIGESSIDDFYQFKS